MSKKNDVKEEFKRIRKCLERANNQLQAIQKTMLSLYEAQVQVSSYIAGTQEQREEKRSLAALYSGVLWGAFMGILGNVFVSYFFAEPTLINILGLTASGIACFVNACMLFIQVRKYSKP